MDRLLRGSPRSGTGGDPLDPAAGIVGSRHCNVLAYEINGPVQIKNEELVDLAGAVCRYNTSWHVVIARAPPGACFTP
jgi:hypothetical protein